MIKPESGFFTSFDGTRLHFRRWRPEKPRATVVYLHGLQSHGEWFVGTCGSVADQGFDVIALDRRGSGLSQGPREHMDRITHVVRDHRLFLEWLRSQDPDLPIILFAHSWGGLLGVFLAGYPRTHDHVNGLVLISPGLIGRRRMISKWALFPFLLWSWLSPRKMLPMPYDESAALTSDHGRAEWIRRDPLRWTNASARFWWETAKLMAYVRAVIRKVDQPVYCALAGEDRIVDNGRVIELLRRMTHVENRVKIYENAYHTMEFEDTAATVAADAVAFLDEMVCPQEAERVSHA